MCVSLLHAALLSAIPKMCCTFCKLLEKLSMLKQLQTQTRLHTLLSFYILLWKYYKKMQSCYICQAVTTVNICKYSWRNYALNYRNCGVVTWAACVFCFYVRGLKCIIFAEPQAALSSLLLILGTFSKQQIWKWLLWSALEIFKEDKANISSAGWQLAGFYYRVHSALSLSLSWI